ncbi:Alpha/Beta hydrolase protein [Lipomyces orientalis]|uniref:Alpha/Beta hydrolase protein n=1 Tax=Lipomyces orientalis TaxID=1233043 RepID=A0ACC3TIC2_9ASCO
MLASHAASTVLEKPSLAVPVWPGRSSSSSRLGIHSLLLRAPSPFHCRPFSSKSTILDNRQSSNRLATEHQNRTGVEKRTELQSQNTRISHYQNRAVLSSFACYARRIASFFFTCSFLGSLLTAAIITDVGVRIRKNVVRAFGNRVAEKRPFAALERERAKKRTKNDKKVVCDIDYYASLVGLRAQQFEVITEDRFVLQLFRIYDPNEIEERKKSRYPVLLIHGLLQSAGVFCVNEEDSLAFFLCKSGYDVWLGNNRCGFNHKHLDFQYNNPRMWEWDVRDMGTKDVPAFIDFILQKTSHQKAGLVCHSQGTTQIFLALSRFHTPELGEKISGFCALAPAVYAGPLVDRQFFKYIRYLSPSAYRLLFGIHAFIPAMFTIRSVIPRHALTYCSYAMFHFLFGWSDDRWDKFLEDRMFQFSPVYVSTESMRWWLGRDGFATRRCIFDSESSEPWFDSRCPPIALWVAQADSLVDGERLIKRLENAEPDVVVVKTNVIPTYEHVDVLWAVDAVDQVGRGVREVLWSTAFNRENFRCPTECEEL